MMPEYGYERRESSRPLMADGTVLTSLHGMVWRVHAPGRWQLARRAGWHARVLAHRALAALRLPVPPWAQTAELVLATDWGDVRVRVVRDVESTVTWVPDEEV